MSEELLFPRVSTLTLPTQGPLMGLRPCGMAWTDEPNDHLEGLKALCSGYSFGV